MESNMQMGKICKMCTLYTLAMNSFIVKFLCLQSCTLYPDANMRVRATLSSDYYMTIWLKKNI